MIVTVETMPRDISLSIESVPVKVSGLSKIMWPSASLIVQSYVVASEGGIIRIRLAMSN